MRPEGRLVSWYCSLVILYHRCTRANESPVRPEHKSNSTNKKLNRKNDTTPLPHDVFLHACKPVRVCTASIHFTPFQFSMAASKCVLRTALDTLLLRSPLSSTAKSSLVSTAAKISTCVTTPALESSLCSWFSRRIRIEADCINLATYLPVT
ncbi:hypothetical protein C8R45DRAFT_1006345 [Mycena sanguinolenta]|nr:hypothetical protein C8R45DRAFT_1006345 [Mycena sanguinolenta]